MVLVLVLDGFQFDSPSVEYLLLQKLFQDDGYDDWRRPLHGLAFHHINVQLLYKYQHNLSFTGQCVKYKSR